MNSVSQHGQPPLKGGKSQSERDNERRSVHEDARLLGVNVRTLQRVREGKYPHLKGLIARDKALQEARDGLAKNQATALPRFSVLDARAISSAAPVSQITAFTAEYITLLAAIGKAAAVVEIADPDGAAAAFEKTVGAGLEAAKLGVFTHADGVNPRQLFFGLAPQTFREALAFLKAGAAEHHILARCVIAVANVHQRVWMVSWPE
jgi:hypothetical protein